MFVKPKTDLEKMADEIEGWILSHLKDCSVMGAVALDRDTVMIPDMELGKLNLWLTALRNNT